MKREKRSEQRRKRGKPTKRSCARSMAELRFFFFFFFERTQVYGYYLLIFLLLFSFDRTIYVDLKEK